MSEIRTLSETERRDWLRLIRSENVGPRTFIHLLQRFGSVRAALDGAAELSRRGGRKRAIRIATDAEIESELERIAACGGRLLASIEPDYPELLAAIADPPPVLTVIGDAAMLNGPTIAVVGARNASAAGRRFARELSATLGEAGYVICSGLARGIDSAAHEASLASGTIAVMAGGADVVYPPENRDLHAEIARRGTLVSEQRAGLAPTGRHFPPRNRLISGLSLGVVVVEAAAKSGSLITARLALEQGREIFAVPGSPLDPRARGPNRLIRDGAMLIESASDVVETLSGPLPLRRHRRGAGLVPEPPMESGIEAETETAEARQNLLKTLGATPVTVDELVRECQFSPAAIHSALLELELAGRVERQAGNKVSLVL